MAGPLGYHGRAFRRALGIGFTARLLSRSARFDTPRDARDNPARFRDGLRWVPGAVEVPLDEKLNQMLRELRRALSEAISESTEVNRTLRKIREEGYSLYLLVDCKREANEEPVTIARGSHGDPVFQIDGRDLSFLRSIGIDPTRRLRRRRPQPIE